MSDQPELVEFDPFQAVTERNHFYTHSYRKMIFSLMASLWMNVTLGIAAGYLYSHPATPVYFPITLNGQILPLYNLDEPNISDKDVLNWAEQVAKDQNPYRRPQPGTDARKPLMQF